MEVTPGYKQTEVGIIPEDWDASTLGNLCTKIQDGNYGFDYPKSHEFFDSGVPFLTSKAIGKDGHLRPELIDFISVEKHAQLTKAHIQSGDVLFTNRGASVGAIGLVDDRIDQGNIGPQLTLLRADPANVSSMFLFQAMKSASVQRQILSQDSGSAMRFFGIAETKRFVISIPRSHAEQEAIAGALSDADALIESLEQLVAKKRQIKHGAMQELLTGQKRLPGFSNEWELKRLGEVAEIVMGQSPSSSNYNSQGNGLPLIQGNADIANRKTIKRIFTTQITKLGRAGDTLMSVRAPVGEVSRAIFDACLGRGVCAIRYPGDYLYHLLIYLEPTWRKRSKGSTFDSVNSTDVRALEVELPSDQTEQTAIATILSDMDADIAALETKLAKARQIKQGMMQELLTGRIRLV